MNSLRKLTGLGKDAPNVSTPKSGRSTKSLESKDDSKDEEKKEEGLGRVRKRLSVMSDSTLVDGVSDLNVDDNDEDIESKQEGGDFIISSYAGVSKKGFAFLLFIVEVYV